MYRNLPPLVPDIEYTCLLNNYMNGSFYFLIESLNQTIKLADFTILEFLILFEYLNNKESDQLLDINILIKGSTHYRHTITILFTVNINPDFLEFSQNHNIVKLWFDNDYNQFLDGHLGYKTGQLGTCIDILNESFVPTNGKYEIKPKNN